VLEVVCNISRADHIYTSNASYLGGRGWREIKARLGIPICYCCVAVRDCSVVSEFHVYWVGSAEEKGG
jgi:hypothetical protein